MLCLPKVWQRCDVWVSDFQKKTSCSPAFDLGCQGAIPVSLGIISCGSGVALGTDGGFYSGSWAKRSSYLVAILGNILPFFSVMQWLPVCLDERLLAVFMKNIMIKCNCTLAFRSKCRGCLCCINQLSGVGLFCCLIPQWCHNTEFWTAVYVTTATDWCHRLKDMTSAYDHAEARSGLWRRKLTNAHLKSKQGECRVTADQARCFGMKIPLSEGLLMSLGQEQSTWWASLYCG